MLIKSSVNDEMYKQDHLIITTGLFLISIKHYALADPREGARDVPPPKGSNFFHFHAIFGKKFAK